MNWKLIFFILAIALPGSFAISYLALPQMIEDSGPVPLKTIQLATAIQNTILVCIATFTGTYLAKKVGLLAPVLSALISRQPVVAVLRSQLIPGFLGGLAGMSVILLFYSFLPAELSPSNQQRPVPILARVLYGGITEEVLLRWGIMTFIVWLAWKIIRTEAPSAGAFWSGIIVSALLFGLSHIPAALAAAGTLTTFSMIYIAAGNAMFGLVAGFLFWRYGLEAAILAHILAHILAYAIRG